MKRTIVREAEPMSIPPLAAPRSHKIAAWLVAALATLVFGNVAAYIAYAGNPLAMADTWYFLDAFLVRAYEQGFGLVDLYVKRGGIDHAQPLQKLLLLANTRWFAMDFVVESFAGLGMALGTYIVIQRQVLGDQARQQTPGWIKVVSGLAIAATIVSLNAGMIFNWSLVTLGYLPHLFAVIACVLAWQALHGAGWLKFGLMFLLISFSMDSMASITGASLVVAGLLACLLRQAPWRQFPKLLGCILVMLLLYRLASAGYLHAHLPAAPAADGRLDALVALLPSLPQMAVTILGTSLAHMIPLQGWFGEGAAKAQTMLAIIVGCAHLWFWYRVLRQRWNGSIFLAVVMMLMFYASVLGIIVGRITVFGPTYLNEPRYVLTYQMGIVALLVMFAGSFPVAHGSSGWRRHLGVAAAICVVLLQLPLSRHSWDEGRYLQGYYHTMARQMYLLGLDPSLEPATCVPMLTICSAPEKERERSIGFLQRHQLNAYSPAILARYSLQATTTPPTPLQPMLVSPAP